MTDISRSFALAVFASAAALVASGCGCPTGLTACADSCANFQSDNLNCGACGNACGAGQSCVAGACVVTCSNGLTECGGVCRDLQSDLANCGACGTACDTGKVCSNGACATACGAGLTDCNGSCRDLQSDRANCGACGTACKPGEVCEAGACGLSCQSSLTACDGTCRDLQSDPANCGGCGMACAPGQVCSSGSCALSCQTGLTSCNGSCRDLETDPAHCGDCGTPCATGEQCVAGACTLSCQSGLTACGGTCRDLQTDSAHCGDCGTPCATGEQCVAGACTLSCQSGLTDCSGTCRDLQTDSANCGACGTACPDGQECASGMCVASCAAPLAVCANACVDPRYDPANCGGCGNACTALANAAPACFDGACGLGPCNTGFLNCDANGANGCEVNTASDNANCGACGVKCGAVPNGATSCTAGACTVTSCTPGRKDCDAIASNGCEVNVTNDVNNCGTCGNQCPSSNVCSNGACVALGGSGTVADPFHSASPLASCKAYKAQFGAAATTGVYLLDTDGAGARAPFNAYCEQTMDGGGWILALSRPIAALPTWGCLTPGAPPTGPANNVTTVLDYGAFTEAGVGEMMLMGGQRILKFYYPRSGVSFQTNYRLLTERNCFDTNHFAADAPHTGTSRDLIGHLNDACTTGDFAIFKAKDPSCPRDSSNSHNGTYNGSWGNCPGCGTNPPSPTPNCWFYGGSQASNVPLLSNCPTTSRASWGDYSTGDMTGGNYVLYVR